MTLTLAELRAQGGPTPLPRAASTVTLVEGQHLLADAQRLEEEREDLAIAGQDEDGKPVGPPSKAGQGGKTARDRKARLDEIAAEMAAIVAKLSDFQGVVDLVGLTGGEWQRFKDDNPPREDNAADVRLTRGHCNASAVFADLGRYVTSWNGEKVATGDWDSWLAERITYADRRDLVIAVVQMHEQGLARAPKSPSSSSTTSSAETA